MTDQPKLKALSGCCKAPVVIHLYGDLIWDECTKCKQPCGLLLDDSYPEVIQSENTSPQVGGSEPTPPAEWEEYIEDIKSRIEITDEPQTHQSFPLHLSDIQKELLDDMLDEIKNNAIIEIAAAEKRGREEMADKINKWMIESDTTLLPVGGKVSTVSDVLSDLYKVILPYLTPSDEGRGEV